MSGANLILVLRARRKVSSAGDRTVVPPGAPSPPYCGQESREERAPDRLPRCSRRTAAGTRRPGLPREVRDAVLVSDRHIRVVRDVPVRGVPARVAAPIVGRAPDSEPAKE